MFHPDMANEMRGSGRSLRFPYFNLLPYEIPKEERNNALDKFLEQLYIAIQANDIVVGAVRWTNELEAWLKLKHEISQELKAILLKLYYMLCLAPGIDPSAAKCFVNMVQTLTQ
jgi:proteasome activator subunit 4